MSKVLFFGFDTNNLRNDRICRLALILEEDGEKVYEKSWLVNPETPFSALRTAEHGISEETVKEAPLFPEVWKEVRNDFESSLLAGHNVFADMLVLDRLFRNYDIDEAAFTYTDTMIRAGQMPYGTASFGLKSLCQVYGVEMDKAAGCNGTVRSLRSLWHVFDDQLPFDIHDEHTYWFGNVFSKEDEGITERALLDLDGILFGIASDGVVLPDELTAVEDWHDEYAWKKESPGFRTAYAVLRGIFDTGTITDRARFAIHNLAYRYSERKYTSPAFIMRVLRGIVQGIMSDRKISEDEIIPLRQWLHQNDDLKNHYTFASFLNLVESVLDENMLSREDSKELLTLFDHFTDPVGSRLSSGNVPVKGKKIAITGDFVIGTHAFVREKILQSGGIFCEELEKDTAILIVGSHVAMNWSEGEYGETVKAALAMQEEGNPILILGEAEVF